MEFKCLIFLFSTCKGGLVDCEDSCVASEYTNTLLKYFCKMLFCGIYFIYFLNNQ